MYIHIEVQLCFPRESRSNDTPVAMSSLRADFGFQ